MTEDRLDHMMDIIDQAIGLDGRPPYEVIVNTDFVEKAMCQNYYCYLTLFQNKISHFRFFPFDSFGRNIRI